MLNCAELESWYAEICWLLLLMLKCWSLPRFMLKFAEICGLKPLHPLLNYLFSNCWISNVKMCNPVEFGQPSFDDYNRFDTSLKCWSQILVVVSSLKAWPRRDDQDGTAMAWPSLLSSRLDFNLKNLCLNMEYLTNDEGVQAQLDWRFDRDWTWDPSRAKKHWMFGRQFIKFRKFED